MFPTDELLRNIGFTFGGIEGRYTLTTRRNAKFHFQVGYFDGAENLYQKLLQSVWQSGRWGFQAKDRAELYSRAEQLATRYGL